MQNVVTEIMIKHTTTYYINHDRGCFMVSILAFKSNDASLNPAGFQNFSSTNEKMETVSFENIESV